jgi:hypothetical protein
MSSYQPLTSVNRIVDIELPQVLEIGGDKVKVPSTLLNKSVHYYVDSTGKVIKAAWISAALAHILNAARQEDQEIRLNELERAITSIDQKISNTVKTALRGKSRRGFMGFSQAHENVPQNSLVISERTFDYLVSKNNRWAKAQKVYLIRFPNLGPATTVELDLVVCTDRIEDKISEDSIGYRKPELRNLMDLFKGESTYKGVQLAECIYLNPSTLKECLEGDGDGDLVYAIISKRGKPKFTLLDMVRKPGPIQDEEIEKLLFKAKRTKDLPTKNYLSEMFDDVPIGSATYAIRYWLFQTQSEYKDKKNPSHWAWKEISGKAISLIECVMDIRKGDLDSSEIERNLNFIDAKIDEISIAQQEGEWFPRVVTSPMIDDLDQFCEDFSTLQDFIDYITGKPKQA